MVVNSGVAGKGWYNESLRHSEAKRYGKATGGKISSPKSMSGSNSKNKKPNVVDIADKKISAKQAVRYHNKEAKKALRQNNIPAYRYHTKEAVKINEKRVLKGMQK